MPKLTLAESDLTHDAFLGGKLWLWQPKRGYRAGVDPVLLAASVPAMSGQSVLDLGCGCGTAALCLGARIPGLKLTGVELQEEYAALARRNGAENNADLSVFTADLRALPNTLRQQQFAHVMMNPPYFDRRAGSPAQDHGRDTAFGGETPLETWIDIGIRRLAPKGYLTLIQRMERLPDVLNAVGNRLGGVVVLPVVAREGKAPERFILRGIHSGRAAFVMSAPLVMHDGDSHVADAESYTPRVRRILRDAQMLDITS